MTVIQKNSSKRAISIPWSGKRSNGGWILFLAIQMATLNAAEYFRLDDLGAIAPGYRADIVSFDHLGQFQIKKVFKDGALVAENGEMLSPR